MERKKHALTMTKGLATYFDPPQGQHLPNISTEAERRHRDPPAAAVIFCEAGEFCRFRREDADPADSEDTDDRGQVQFRQPDRHHRRQRSGDD